MRSALGLPRIGRRPATPANVAAGLGTFVSPGATRRIVFQTLAQEDDIGMSHIVTIQTKVHDLHAVAAACRRLNLAAPVQGTAKLYSGEAEGLVVRFPGWQY